MPIDLGRKQSIEEITNGRIKKKPREKAEARPAERPRPAARPEMARKIER